MCCHLDTSNLFWWVEKKGLNWISNSKNWKNEKVHDERYSIHSRGQFQVVIFQWALPKSMLLNNMLFVILDVLIKWMLTKLRRTRLMIELKMEIFIYEIYSAWNRLCRKNGCGRVNYTSISFIRSNSKISPNFPSKCFFITHGKAVWGFNRVKFNTITEISVEKHTIYKAWL